MDFKEYEGNSFVRIMKRLDAKISGYLVTYSAYTRLASAVIEKHIVGEPATGKGGQKTAKRAGGRSRTTVDNMIETIKAHNDRRQTPIDLPPSRAQRTIVASLMRASGLSGQAAMKNVVTKALRPAGRSQRRRELIPGEQVEVDSTRLDVRLIDRGTGKEVSAELLIAVDRATRSLLALRLVPGATTAADVAGLVFSMSSPKQARTVLRDGAAWNYSWMTPDAIAHWSSTSGAEKAGSYYGIPFVMVQEIICDHGMAYMARAVMSVLRRNGISLSPSRTASPWDKPHVERWFLYLRKALLMFLHGYTGGSVQDRNGEIVAALYIDEMEHLLLTFVAEIHQHRTIRGFRHPADPGRDLNPRAALEAAAREGTLLLPDFDEERVFDYLPTVFLKPDGAGFISLKGHKFSSPTTKMLRRKEGPYENGKWAFKFDAHDFRFIWFHNPVTQSYEPVENRDFGDAPRPLPERRIENARRDLARAGIPKSRVKAATRAMLLAEGIDLADDASEMRVALDRIHAERTAGLANVIPLSAAAGLDAEGFVDDSEDSDHDDADWTDTDGGGYFDDMAERA
jgi:hypothetical protein